MSENCRIFGSAMLFMRNILFVEVNTAIPVPFNVEKI